MRVAAIDIGTLTCRLLAAEVFPEAKDPLHAIRSEREILRLGEGVDRTGRLTSEAMSRVIEELNAARWVVNEYGLREGVLVHLVRSCRPHS